MRHPTIDRTIWPAQGGTLRCQPYDEGMSAAWMGAAVDFQQAFAVDAGVYLRGRERGVAEQLLDRAEIAATGQEMRGKGMAQRMWRRAVGQPQRATQPLHRKLDDAGAQRPTARADEHRP